MQINRKMSFPCQGEDISNILNILELLKKKDFRNPSWIGIGELITYYFTSTNFFLKISKLTNFLII